MMIYVVSTCIPDRGEKPCLPNVFATLAEAEAYADQMLRNEWENAPTYAEDDEYQERPLPYPGDWREANDAIAASYDDGSWGEWELTSHEVASPMRAALEAAEHWLAEEAASPHPGQTRPDDILRVIRDALGKPHDATDAAPSAPQTPAPDLSLPDYEAQARAAGWSLYRLEDGCGATDVEFYAWRGGNVLEPEHETSAVADEATAWRDACNHDAMLAKNAAAEGREG